MPNRIILLKDSLVSVDYHLKSTMTADQIIEKEGKEPADDEQFQAHIVISKVTFFKNEYTMDAHTIGLEDSKIFFEGIRELQDQPWRMSYAEITGN